MNHTISNTNLVPISFTYSIINSYDEYLSEYDILHDDIIKTKYIDEFSKLYFEGLKTYYAHTKRCNLLNYNFITYKLAELLNDQEQIVHMNLNIKLSDIGLQNMLWEILHPDSIELS
jgi:hypothetical protein